MLNKKKIKISVTGYDNSSNALKFNFEKETNKNVVVSVNAYSVNGIMVSDNMFDMTCNIAKKRKANDNLEIDSDFLEDRGITGIRFFDIIFHVWDEDNLDDVLNTNVLRIKTNLFDGESDKINGTKMINDKGIRVDYIGNDEDTYVFSLKNTNKDYVITNLDNLTVNDYTSDDINFDSAERYVFKGQTALIKVEVSDEFKEKNGVDTVKKIEFTIRRRIKGSYYKEKKTKIVKLKL